MYVYSFGGYLVDFSALKVGSCDFIQYATFERVKWFYSNQSYNFNGYYYL